MGQVGQAAPQQRQKVGDMPVFAEERKGSEPDPQARVPSTTAGSVYLTFTYHLLVDLSFTFHILFKKCILKCREIIKGR